MLPASQLGVSRNGLLAAVLGLAWSATSLAQPASRAWVLDSGWNAVVALDPATGRRLATLTVKSRPEGLLLSPDGARLVVLERGPGEDKAERGFKAKGRSVATVVDTDAMTILGRVELGHGVDTRRAWFGGGRVTVLCPGYEARNPAEGQPRELVVIDLTQGSELGRVTLEHGVHPVRLARDERTLVLAQGLPRSAKPPYPRSRVFFVDVAEPMVVSSLEAGGWGDLQSDGRWLYLLDRGRPDPDARKNSNGSVQVVSLETRAVASIIDAGRGPRGLVSDGESPGVMVVSDGPPGRLDAELRVIEGDSVALTRGIAAGPKLIGTKRDLLLVVGAAAVTLVDPLSGEIFATLPLRRGSERLVFDDEIPRELEISPDGRRAFVLYEPGNKLLVLDLEERQLLGVAKTGRGGRKLLRGVAPLLDAATLLPAPVGDFASVAGLAAAVPSFGRERPGNQLLAVRADGRFAYALSASTEDVTVVDTTTAAAVTKIAVGGHRLKALGGAAHIAVIASGRLHILDTAANRTGARLELPGLKDVAVSPDGRHALALADRTVLCLDGVTGSVIATVKGFVQPTAAVFTAAPPAP